VNIQTITKVLCCPQPSIAISSSRATGRSDRTVRVHAVDFDQQVTFSLDDIQHDVQCRWSNYERGVAWVLQQEGYALRGMDMAIAGDVPIASGLSSSAAIEVATAYAFSA